MVHVVAAPAAARMRRTQRRRRMGRTDRRMKMRRRMSRMRWMRRMKRATHGSDLVGRCRLTLD
jgi:hypothetical protein